MLASFVSARTLAIAAATAAAGAGVYALRAKWRATAPRPGYVVAVDCEPDDELALGVMRARGLQVTALVVGEGNVDAKRARAAKYAERLGWPAAVLVRGVPSAKLFPGEAPMPADAAPFSVDAFLWALESAGPDPTLVCLKPPREILAALEQQPVRARAVFARTTLAAYGSFNFRTVGYSRTMPLVSEDTPFKRVLYYESHGNAVPNLNPSTAPRVRSWLTKSWPSFAADMHATCTAWDTDILRDCDESCAEEEAAASLTAEPNRRSDRWRRNDKCRTDVRAHTGAQFVPADPVLALLLDNPAFPPAPAVMSHSGSDGQYPTLRLIARGDPAAETTKLFTWQGIGAAQVVGALDDALLR
jgi:hypothetical protein